MEEAQQSKRVQQKPVEKDAIMYSRNLSEYQTKLEFMQFTFCCKLTSEANGRSILFGDI